MIRKVIIAAIAVHLAAGIVLAASWYDEYEAGINAVRKGQWQVVVQKMTSAIGGNGKEDNKAREYGTIFINYHPYYYRGVAYLNLGRYQEAISDFEKTMGPGEENLGTIEMLMDRAKTKLAGATNPEPQPPAPQPTQPIHPVPVPVPTPQPTGPVIDPALRQRAQAAINDAKQHLTAAQQRKATQSPQYGQALSAIADANTRNATAKSNDDLNAVIALAENATAYADAAAGPNVTVPTTTIAHTSTAADTVLADTGRRVRQALESYFSGDFNEASQQFARLSQEMPKNGWIWAFLGASQYSRFEFEADATYKDAAIQSFRKAKQLRSWGDGLPKKYFSKKIRTVFDKAS